MNIEIFVLLYTATLLIGGLIWMLGDDTYGHR